MVGVIFDLDQTLIDSSIAYEARKNGDWSMVYDLIPHMRPYEKVVGLVKTLVNQGIEVAIVTSSPLSYCQRVLGYLGITDVITVCYHETIKHKPDPEPILLAVRKMEYQEGKIIIAIGDDDNDTLAANRAGVISVQGFWGNPYGYSKAEYQANVFCKDEESLVKYFTTRGIRTGECGFRERAYHTYQLFDYYPMTKKHDMWSQNLFNEVKERNNSTSICKMFCREFEDIEIPIVSGRYGVFVVPSSTAGRWNRKLTDYVIPRIVRSRGLIDCSKHILRHTAHEKQAFGGERSIDSNLATLRLQYQLPSQMEGAIIIDDITTSGNIFESCKRILCDAGVDGEKIYCVAIGGTV